MGGVALNFSRWPTARRTAAGDWEKPRGPLRRGAAQPVGAVPDRRPEPEAGHLRRAVRLRLSAAAADDGQGDHRRQGRPDRRQLLDAVPEHQELQGAGVLLHAVLLVALRRAGSRICGSAPRLPPVGAEQAVPDGDAVRPGVRRRRTRRARPTPASRRLVSRRAGRQDASCSTASPRTTRPRCGTA